MKFLFVKTGLTPSHSAAKRRGKPRLYENPLQPAADRESSAVSIASGSQQESVGFFFLGH